MNEQLQRISDSIQQNDNLTTGQKAMLLQSLKDADKEIQIANFKEVEAQHKELEIEAALEKVRSRSLAMHKTDELKDVVAILFDKLKELNVEFDGGAAIHLFNEGSMNAEILVAAPGLANPIVNKLPYDKDEFIDNP